MGGDRVVIFGAREIPNSTMDAVTLARTFQVCVSFSSFSFGVFY